jgi:hypothetical protein
MSRELFERLRPYIQAMLDAQQSAPPPVDIEDEADPVPYIYSAVQFQDNLTGEWHRLFLYNDKLYREVAEYDESAQSGGRTRKGDPGLPLEENPLGSDESIALDADDNILLDNNVGRLTTTK